MQISNSDFGKFIKKDYYYVDKSLLIEELLNNQNELILLPRPRRFGKTLNLSMLKYYFDIREDNKDLFKGLEIEKRDIFNKHINKYPTIYLTLKEVKGLSWDKIYGSFKVEISDLYKEHKYLLKSNKLDNYDKELIDKIIRREVELQDYERSLYKLSEYMYKHYGKEVVILLDEYDTVMNSFYDKDTYNNIASFLRGFIGSAFKDNKYLSKGVITGILRIAKESIFSGANNIAVYNILDNDFSNKFGFTEDEVAKILKYFDLENKAEEVRNWYNGYTFGNNVIYNPFSIANYVQTKALKLYWLNTSNNSLIEDLLINSDESVKEKLEELIKGNSIKENIEESIIFNEINTRYLWSLLLFSGYLKAIEAPNGKYILSIPNREIGKLYNKIMEKYFTDLVPELSNIMDNISHSLVSNDIENFSKEFEKLLISKISSYDIGKRKEGVYHVILLLSLLRLEHKNQYEVKSNGESGHGRYDICVIPKNKNKTGYIIEIKVAKKNEDLKNKAEKAIKQIEEKEYTTELKNKSIKSIVLLGIAFEGKRIYIIDKKI